MQKLAMLDASFLYLESATMPMNIGSVQKFVLSSTVDEFYERLRATLKERAPGISFMSCKPVSTPLGLDHPVWAADEHFDIDQHLERRRLSGKGTQRQWEKKVAECHEEHLPRDRPLWKYYLFEGVHDGSVILFEKYHHACFDGVAGQQVMDLLFTETPDGVLPPVEPLSSDSTASPELGSLLFDAALQLTRQSLRSVRQAPQGVAAMGRLARQFLRDEQLREQRAPRTPFNATISPYRSWTCASVSLSEARGVAKANGCSLNDVFLTICAGGIVRYLERDGELPAAPLICGVPVSLRRAQKRADKNDMNNRVGMVSASLATDLHKPLNRLGAIAASMRRSKQLVENMAEVTPDDFHLPGIGGFFGLATALSGLTRWADRAPPALNLIISNVPGPRTRRYLCGAELVTHYPVSIPGDGMALNITCQSYMDRLDIGFTACEEVVPDLRRLRNDTLAAWSELKALSETPLSKPSTKRQRKTARGISPKVAA